MVKEAEDKHGCTRVVGAAIMRRGRILCAQRGPGRSLEGYWEFPGGKIEPGETPRQALEREISEELRCRVEVRERVCTSRYSYEFGRIELSTFVCHLIGGDPHLTEHEQIRWTEPEDLNGLDWAPVDRPAAAILASRTQEG